MQLFDTSTLEAQVAERLQPLLRERGYQWLPHLHQFRRSRSKGFSCVILSTSHYENGSLLEVHLGLRHDDVENLAFPFTNGLPGFQPDSMTLVTPMSRLFGKPYQRFEVRSQDSLDSAIEQLSSQLQEEGLEFLKDYSELAAVDRLLNAQPEEPVQLLHNQINRCFRALVSAKLRQRTDFAALAEHYARFLQERLFAPAPTLEKFGRLRRFLEQYSMN